LNDGRDPIPRWVPTALFAGTIVLYLWTLGGPSLWLDEAWEANYYAGYTAAPWYNRPILYMGAARAMVRLVGPSEFALRLPTCLAALGAIALTYRLARRHLGRGGSILAAGLLAFAGPFVRESHQLKHYAFDAAFTALLVLAFARWRDRREPRRLIAYTLAAIVSFGFSFSSVFVVAAIAGYELVAEGFAWRRLRAVAGAHVAIAAAFAVNFAIFHRDGGRDPLLVAYFAESYAPLAAPWRIPFWLGRAAAAIAALQTGAASGWAAVVLAAAGWWQAVRHGAGIVAWTLALALAANAAASGFALYPFGVERLSIYVAPLLAILMAHGLALLRPQGPARAPRWVAVTALAGALFVPSAVVQAGHLVRGWTREEIRGFVARLAVEAVPGETLYVGEDALSAFQFYWCRNGKHYPPENLVVAARLRQDPARHASEIDALATRGAPLWSLLTHMPQEESDVIVALLAARFDHAGSSIVGDARLDRWRSRPPSLEPAP
jgi:hypothetical protein